MYERPGSFHLAGLEIITKGSEVWISKEATVGVIGRCRVPWKTALIVAHFWAVRALLAVRRELRWWRWRRCTGTWLGCRPLLGAVVLDHQILDAMLGGVICQITSTGTCCPAYTAVIRPQRYTELLLGSRVCGGGPKFCVTLENLALQTHCRGDKDTVIAKEAQSRL